MTSWVSSRIAARAEQFTENQTLQALAHGSWRTVAKKIFAGHTVLD
jgi:hypothetical protein